MLSLIFLCLGAFVLGLVTDWVWTRWMQNVAEKHQLAAANWSVLVYVVGLLWTQLIVQGMWVPIIFYLIGGWIGTYYAVKEHN